MLTSRYSTTLKTRTGRFFWVVVGIFGILVSLLGNPAQAQIDKVYWVEAGSRLVRRTNLDGSNLETVVSLGGDVPHAVAVDALGGKIYITIVNNSKIMQADLDGSNLVDLITGLGAPRGMATDPSAAKIYWADSGIGAIQRANSDGTDLETVITGLDNPRNLDVDPIGQMAYWTDPGVLKVQRAGFDGTGLQDLATSLGFPDGLKIDRANQKVYWADNGTDKIQRANLDGTSLEDVVTSGVSALQGVAVDGAGGKVYWTDSTTSTLERADLDGTNREILQSGLSFPDGMDLFLCIPPSIDVPPLDQTVCIGDPVTLSVTSTGSPDFAFQWKKDSLPIPGETDSTLMLASAMAADSGNYTVEVTNPCGSVESVAAVLDVGGTTPPAIVCPNDIAVECAGANGAVVSFVVTATDDCGSTPTVVCEPPSESLFPLGSSVVSCTATDDAGNTSSCTFTVTVADTTDPALTCPTDITAECTTSAGAIVPFMATAIDTCDPNPTVACTPPSGSLFPIGTTMVNCTATDAAGNSDSCTFNVTVEDTTPPGITCPADITAECTSPTGAIVTFAATASDTCDPSPTVACTPPSGSLFPIGTTMVNCTATDAAGNSDSCTFNVTVEDTTAPEITCPADIVAECEDENGAIVSFSVTATDDCDDTVTIVCSPASGDLFGFGTTSVFCSATDDAGNTANCSFSVTIEDTIPPTITCPTDIEIDVSDVNAPVTFVATATDQCDPAPLVQCSPPSGSVFPPGVNPVVCMALDADGNMAMCEFTVTIRPTLDFDTSDLGPVADMTFIEEQYLDLCVRVSGFSDAGTIGGIARSPGPPGSSTDDMIPVSPPNYLQTYSGADDSDSGILSFDFLDAETGLPKPVSFVELTFLDIEDSGQGIGGRGRSRLTAYDESGILVDQMLIPVGTEGNQFTASVTGNQIARVDAAIGDLDDSGGVDQLVFMPSLPAITTRLLASKPEVYAGDVLDLYLFLGNNTHENLPVDFSLRGTLGLSRPGRTVFGRDFTVLSGGIDLMEGPTVFSIPIPSNKPAIWNRTVFFVATYSHPDTGQVIEEAVATVVIRPPA